LSGEQPRQANQNTPVSDSCCFCQKRAMAKRVRTVKKADIENVPSGKRAKSATEQGKIKGRELYLLEITIYVLVILLLSAGTDWRNKVWNSEVELWTDCVRKSPDKDRPHLRLGAIFVRQGRYQEAMSRYTEALRIKPDYAEAHYELGTAYLAMGDRDSALREYEILKSKNPRLADALSKGIK